MLLSDDLISGMKLRGFTYGGDLWVRKDLPNYLYPFFWSVNLSLVFYSLDDIFAIIKYKDSCVR
ncbi:hypothetical protein [Selenomonas ruminantium]|uniref:hypothetical protein n=1 Tax=Selenomonas ruminantium TaxID=971 RepID=UPI0026EB9F09|nr:hypothetical protein [Selenomonas ruminantium]